MDVGSEYNGEAPSNPADQQNYEKQAKSNSLKHIHLKSYLQN